jgi:hypothetical protein
MRACRRAVTPMLRRDHGVASSIQKSSGPRGPPFCCWAVVPRHRRQARALAAARRLGNEVSDRLHCAFPPRARRVGQCRSPQWRRRGPGSGSVPGRTLWRGGGRLAERGTKARDAGRSDGRSRHAESRWAGPRVARLGVKVGWAGRCRAHLTARGGLTARVPRGTDSDGARLTAARLQPWGTDLLASAGDAGLGRDRIQEHSVARWRAHGPGAGPAGGMAIGS